MTYVFEDDNRTFLYESTNDVVKLDDRDLDYIYEVYTQKESDISFIQFVEDFLRKHSSWVRTLYCVNCGRPILDPISKHTDKKHKHIWIIILYIMLLLYTIYYGRG